MKKIRYFFATIMLLASLSGFTVLGLGSSSLATLASNQHITAHQVAIIRRGPCPGSASMDC